jgi:hypothetical protein
MFETYRMLGEQRELELLREAQRLHAGKAVKDGRVQRTQRRRLVSVLRSSAVVLLIRRRSSRTPTPEKLPRSLPDP